MSHVARRVVQEPCSGGQFIAQAHIHAFSMAIHEAHA